MVHTVLERFKEEVREKGGKGMGGEGGEGEERGCPSKEL